MTPPKLAPTAAAAAVVAPTTSLRRNTDASAANSCAGEEPEEEHRTDTPRRRLQLLLPRSAGAAGCRLARAAAVVSISRPDEGRTGWEWMACWLGFFFCSVSWCGVGGWLGFWLLFFLSQRGGRSPEEPRDREKGEGGGI